MDPAQQKQQRARLMRYAGIGAEFGFGIIGLLAAGLLVDWKFGVSPWGVLSGIGLGVIGGTYNLIRQSLKMMREDEAARHTSPQPSASRLNAGSEPEVHDQSEPRR